MGDGHRGFDFAELFGNLGHGHLKMAGGCARIYPGQLNFFLAPEAYGICRCPEHISAGWRLAGIRQQKPIPADYTGIGRIKSRLRLRNEIWFWDETQ